MKKQIISIIFLLIVALFSCGGEMQINNNSLNINVETPAVVVDVDTVPIAEQIVKEWYPDGTYEGYSDSPLSYTCSFDPGCEGCYSAKTFNCFPLEEGGYLVITASVFAGPGCAGDYSYSTWTYKDGVLDTITGILPSPELELLLNPDKTEDYKNDIAEFRKMFEKSPVDFICYDFQPPVSLTVRLNPWDCEEAYYNMDKVRLDSYQGDQLPVYLWDGEKFVKE